MWGVIAEAAATRDAGSVGQMLAYIMGAGVIGGGGYAMGKARKSPQQSEDAQRVYLEDKFATREEVAEIKQQHRAEVSDLHARLTGITVKLNEMYGQQNMMIEILKSRKSL